MLIFLNVISGVGNSESLVQSLNSDRGVHFERWKPLRRDYLLVDNWYNLLTNSFIGTLLS